MQEVTARGTGVELRFSDAIALARSDFVIPAAGVTAVIGPNGSGKSTLLAALAGLHDLAAGSLEVLGSRPADVRSRIAFVPQATKVNDSLPVTVREVVAMGRYPALGLIRRPTPHDQDRIDGAVAKLQLGDLLGRHVRELSGGQRQRVFVAQGLSQDRELLLMDEPTAALDLVSAEVIESVIRDERTAGVPVVVTTHDLAEARQADHVIVLAGAVVAEGTPGSVLTPANLSRAYGFEIDASDHVHIDDPAHAPTGGRHRHKDGPRL